MADTKISDLAALTGANTATGDLFPLVDVSDTTMAASGTTKRITRAELLAALAAELGVAQGDIIIATGANALDNLAPGTVAGKALVADPNATNKVSFNYPQASHYGPGACTSSSALIPLVDRINSVLSNTSVLTSGQLIGVSFQLPKGLTVTSISFWSATTAAGTPTNQWFGLADSSGNILRLTADDTNTAWTANTKKTLNLSSTFTTTYSGLHYALIMVKASTVPTLVSCGSGFAGDLIRTGAGGQFMAARDGTHTGLTDPASSPDPWTPTNSVGPPYCELN